MSNFRIQYISESNRLLLHVLRSHFQLQSPQAFGQSIQELITAVQRNGDPDDLLKMIPQFELLAAIDPAQNG